MHRDGAGRRRQPAERRARPRAADRHEARLGRPSDSRRRGEGRRSGDRRGPRAIGQRGPAARQGPEHDDRLPQRAGADGRGRCATAGTSPATSRSSTRTASSSSRIGCRASARSAARWCRTSRSRTRSTRSSARSRSVVTAVPDATKGERLVAFYTRQDVTPETLWERLCQTDLPRLWLPQARQPRADRGDSDARHGQGRSAARETARARASRRRTSRKSGKSITRGNSATVRRPSWSCWSSLSSCFPSPSSAFRTRWWPFARRSPTGACARGRNPGRLRGSRRSNAR